MKRMYTVLVGIVFLGSSYLSFASWKVLIVESLQKMEDVRIISPVSCDKQNDYTLYKAQINVYSIVAKKSHIKTVPNKITFQHITEPLLDKQCLDAKNFGLLYDALKNIHENSDAKVKAESEKKANDLIKTMYNEIFTK